jgi:hypothetical protein
VFLAFLFSGKLVKQLVIFDMANVGWIMPSSDLVSSQNRASEIAKHLYPQLLDKVATYSFCCSNAHLFCSQVVIINAPWFMSQLWKIAKMMLSESLTGKVAMCSGAIVPDGMSGENRLLSLFFCQISRFRFQCVRMRRSTLTRWSSCRRLWAARAASASRAA